eukprot:g780.t1
MILCNLACLHQNVVNVSTNVSANIDTSAEIHFFCSLGPYATMDDLPLNVGETRIEKLPDDLPPLLNEKGDVLRDAEKARSCENKTGNRLDLKKMNSLSHTSAQSVCHN